MPPYVSHVETTTEATTETTNTPLFDKPVTDEVSLAAEGRDWSDAKLASTTRRDRILPNGVVLELMKRSDWEGCKRLFSNLALLSLTAYAIYKLDIHPVLLGDIRQWTQLPLDKLFVFAILYIAYGFQMQCLAFAGGHELHHGNAFKSKWMSTVATFFVGTAFLEVLPHERIMHKLHHMYTLDINKDPELTSLYSRDELENLKFKSVPKSRYSYLKAFFNVLIYFQHRACRLISSCQGIATDYNGVGWSMQTPRPDKMNSAVIRDLQFWSLLQMTVYIVIFSRFGNTAQGLKNLLFWWIVPCILGYAPINFFRNAEHADCDMTANQLLSTRTVESIWIIRWLLWETNFHAEHHAYPMVPFFNLPKLHVLLNDHIKHNECKSFLSQNWQMIKKGGWIDVQNS
jgi:fatty acid desaturase